MTLLERQDLYEVQCIILCHIGSMTQKVWLLTFILRKQNFNFPLDFLSVHGAN